ncbi:MAG: hypothetical protein BYD32DRAFT_483916 [Podila humilis]|nr:MAG: hypothetical protein BYD32DRAFT_483916 [Podila humilis]
MADLSDPFVYVPIVMGTMIAFFFALILCAIFKYFCFEKRLKGAILVRHHGRPSMTTMTTTTHHLHGYHPNPAVCVSPPSYPEATYRSDWTPWSHSRGQCDETIPSSHHHSIDNGWSSTGSDGDFMSSSPGGGDSSGGWASGGSPSGACDTSGGGCTATTRE